MAEELFDVKLPSNCRFYGVEPGNVKMRIMRGADEKFIAGMVESNQERKFRNLLSRLLVGMDPDKLTIGDRSYLMLWCSINCYSRYCTFFTRCASCGSRTTIDVDFSEIKTKEVQPGFLSPHVVKLSDGTELGVRMLTVADEIAAVDAGADASPLIRLALGINNGTPIEDRIKLVEDMKTLDIMVLRTYHAAGAHGPIMESDYTCEECGYEGRARLPLSFDTFFPAAHDIRGNPGSTV